MLQDHIVLAMDHFAEMKEDPSLQGMAMKKWRQGIGSCLPKSASLPW
jgi:hypothetical protein